MGSLKFFLHSKTSTEDKMNFSIVLLLVVAVVATSARPSDVDHHWEIFKANHPKATHLTEELVRKGLFAKVHQMIEEHNSGNHSYTMAHNMFSDMTEQEKEGYMGLRLPEGLKPMPGPPAMVLNLELLLRWIGVLTLASNQSRTKVNAEAVGLSLPSVPSSSNSAKLTAPAWL